MTFVPPSGSGNAAARATLTPVEVAALRSGQPIAVVHGIEDRIAHCFAAQGGTEELRQIAERIGIDTLSIYWEAPVRHVVQDAMRYAIMNAGVGVEFANAALSAGATAATPPATTSSSRPQLVGALLTEYFGTPAAAAEFGHVQVDPRSSEVVLFMEPLGDTRSSWARADRAVAAARRQAAAAGYADVGIDALMHE